MSRLIREEDVKELLVGLDSLPWEEEAEDMVNRLPTAYNVEEVVKELEELMEMHMARSEDAAEKGFEKHMILEGGKGLAFEQAIEIVKEEGGLVKKTLIAIFCLIFLGLTGCANNHDTIEIHYKTAAVLDNVLLHAPNGYFYESHEKFVVDENKIGVTIYFVTDGNEGWDDKEEVTE